MKAKHYDPNKGQNCPPACARFVRHLSEQYDLNKTFDNFESSKEKELIYLLDNTVKRLDALKLFHNISKKISSGALFSDVLKFTFDTLKEIIPYDEVSFITTSL